jgi:uncharacterized protein (TIGR00661 family)
MKILYAIQGTGNGHITRAIEIIPHLQKHGELDILVSGIQSDIELPFKVKYRFNGLSFVFGKQGGVDIWNTYWKMKSFKLMKEIKSLPIAKYDLIISDFEPVSCWAALKAGKTCIGLSNQVATLHPMAPIPKKTDLIGKLVLSHYAPVTYEYGYHFKALDQHIYTPVIRKEVRALVTTNQGHYTVYLPSYSDEKIIKNLKKFEAIKWEVFSKHSKKKYTEKNISIMPIEKDKFLESLASSEGVLCNAGFGTASEALFLNKKLLVIPMKNQYEQHCNVAMLNSMGVPSMKKLNKKNRDAITNWLANSDTLKVDYPDNAAEIVETIVRNHADKKEFDGFNKATSKWYKHL